MDHPLVFARAPYGYRPVNTGNRQGRIEPRDDKAAVVRQIFRWVADDSLSMYEIAQRLYAQGVPTRADETGSLVTKRASRCAWHPHTIAAIVRSETYAGTWHYGKTRLVPRDDGKEGKVQRDRPRDEWQSVKVEPIVDETTWQRAQERMTEHKRAATNTERVYLLSGRVFCACGRRWTGRYKIDRDAAWYRCPKTDAEKWHQPCSMRFGIRRERLEAAVLGAVQTFMLDADIRRTALAAERERATAEREQLAADLATIDQSLARVERQ